MTQQSEPSSLPPTAREDWCDACDDPQGFQRWSRDHDAWFCVKCWQRINGVTP